MNFLATLLGRKPTPPEVLTLKGPGTYTLPVVGEASYQETLHTLCKHHAGAGTVRIVEAHCIPHSTNPDNNEAVKVEIDGRLVGHLTPTNAREFRQLLTRLGKANAVLVCSASIEESWLRSKSEEEGAGEDDSAQYRVWLDLP